MAKSLSAEKQKDYKEKFSQFDKNGDGKMDKKELRAALKLLKRNPSEVKLGKLDKDKSGFIEYDEFVNLMIKLDKENEREAKEKFDQYDKDKSGFITVDELGPLFDDIGIELTQDELKKEIAGVDVNKDNKLNFQELKKLLEKI